jgi:hypothetical protein
MSRTLAKASTATSSPHPCGNRWAALGRTVMPQQWPTRGSDCWRTEEYLPSGKRSASCAIRTGRPNRPRSCCATAPAVPTLRTATARTGVLPLQLAVVLSPRATRGRGFEGARSAVGRPEGRRHGGARCPPDWATASCSARDRLVRIGECTVPAGQARRDDDYRRHAGRAGLTFHSIADSGWSRGSAGGILWSGRFPRRPAPTGRIV